MDFETKQRESDICIACGDRKDVGNVVCWDCFKYRDNAWKYSELELIDWLKEIGVEVTI